VAIVSILLFLGLPDRQASVLFCNNRDYTMNDIVDVGSVVVADGYRVVAKQGERRG
jgi:hypothetical protein